MPLSVMRVDRMRRTLKGATRAIEEVCGTAANGWVAWFVTLTYRNPDEWQPRHVSGFVDCLQKWGAREGYGALPYVWSAEIQENRLRVYGDAVVHYHLVVWLPAGVELPQPDTRGWWKHGMTNREVARNALSYIMKYATKGCGAPYPRGLRLCGYGGLTSMARAVRYWLCLPGWIHARLRSGMQRVTRQGGGWWMAEGTGELLRSAWSSLRSRNGTVTLRRGNPLLYAS